MTSKPRLQKHQREVLRALEKLADPAGARLVDIYAQGNGHLTLVWVRPDDSTFTLGLASSPSNRHFMKMAERDMRENLRALEDTPLKAPTGASISQERRDDDRRAQPKRTNR